MNASSTKNPTSSTSRRDSRQADFPSSPFGEIELRDLLECLSAAVRDLREEVAAITQARICPDPMVTAAEAAEMFNCSVDRIQQMEREGLPFYRNLGKGHRFRMEDLVRFRDSNLVTVDRGAAPDSSTPHFAITEDRIESAIRQFHESKRQKVGHRT